MFSHATERISNPFIVNEVYKIFIRNFAFKYRRPDPVTPCTRALKYFDEYYKSIFKQKWPSIRLGLLSVEKKVAVINNLVDVGEVETSLQAQGAYDMRYFLERQKDYNIKKRKRQPEKNDKETNSLNLTIKEKLKEVEENELNEIYSPHKNVEVKAKFSDISNIGKKKEKTDQEFVYDPEEANTSMDSDLAKAEIDESRLVVPESNLDLSLLSEFVPVTKLRGLEDYISDTEYYKYYKTESELNLNVIEENTLNFPENIKVYTFDRGDFSEFSSPQKTYNNIYDYLLMDATDLLSALILDVQPGETVLNMMSNSATQLYCLLQTLTPKKVVCFSDKKFNTLKNYLYDFTPTWKNILHMTSSSDVVFSEKYNKILLDIFCADDRESITNAANNYFSQINDSIRLQLPGKQTQSLVKALKQIPVGGAVVYTTKTMCPIQNEGVVVKAIEIAWKETKNEFCIKNLLPALYHTELFFEYARSIELKYGILILPFLPSNFGPRYIAKIVRTQ